MGCFCQVLHGAQVHGRALWFFWKPGCRPRPWLRLWCGCWWSGRVLHARSWGETVFVPPLGRGRMTVTVWPRVAPGLLQQVCSVVSSPSGELKLEEGCRAGHHASGAVGGQRVT